MKKILFSTPWLIFKDMNEKNQKITVDKAFWAISILAGWFLVSIMFHCYIFFKHGNDLGGAMVVITIIGSFFGVVGLPLSFITAVVINELTM